MNFKSIFFKEEEEAPVAKAAAPVPPPPLPTYTVAPAIISASGTDYNKYLSDKIKENNQPGPDYLEFSEALKALDTLPLSEEQKYQVTYPTYLSMGINADKLVASAELYIKLLESEKKDFTTEITNTENQEVVQKQAEIKKLQDKNIELSKQIQDNAQKIQTLTTEVNTTANSLAGEKGAFEAAFNNYTIKIRDQIRKIKTYLDANTPKQ